MIVQYGTESARCVLRPDVSPSSRLLGRNAAAHVAQPVMHWIEHCNNARSTVGAHDCKARSKGYRTKQFIRPSAGQVNASMARQNQNCCTTLLLILTYLLLNGITMCRLTEFVQAHPFNHQLEVFLPQLNDKNERNQLFQSLGHFLAVRAKLSAFLERSI